MSAIALCIALATLIVPSDSFVKGSANHLNRLWTKATAVKTVTGHNVLITVAAPAARAAVANAGGSSVAARPEPDVMRINSEPGMLSDSRSSAEKVPGLSCSFS